ncbi:MAG: voltage-gated potassium channel [Thermoleophilaceae bacterium]|nr:voltage-gated potassium channel [Thermoleophilaceae bacterium]
MAGDGVSVLDAIYYATVTVTTTGYGDIRPESDGARLLSIILVTPARVLFLIVLVGTTLEVLAERTRENYRLVRWRKNLNDHSIIVGFGTKGRSAARQLTAHGVEPAQIIVIDPREEARRHAVALGFAAISGDATQAEVLEEAAIRNARSVVVAVDRDDTAVLTTLTARELNPQVMIAAAVREEQNAHLLRQSGANSVITSSDAAGRLLGVATQSPRVVEVLEDLLTVGQGLDLLERPVETAEVGALSELRHRDPIVAVVRGERLMRFDEADAQQLEPGDRLVYLCSREEA